jgi:hypothetical protein
MRKIVLLLCVLSAACDTRRARDLEQQVEQQQRTIKAQQDEIQSLRARLTGAESKESRREAIAAKNKALMASVPTPPPATASSTAPSGAVVFAGGTPGIDVQKASDFSNATAVIARLCGTAATCAALQREALATLTQGRPANVDERVWNEARVRCAREHPEDYVERVRCEQRVPR